MTGARPEMGRWEVGAADVRMILGERWAPGPLIGWAGMNPSYAGAERTDPTWMAWRSFAMAWGAGGQIVVNPHPGRNSDPTAAIAQLVAMRAGRAQGIAVALEQNLAAVRTVADEPVAWVIGWGDKGAAMNDAVRIHTPFMEALNSGGRRILAFGVTANGNPKHVLARGKSRIPADAGLFEFNYVSRRLGAPVEPRSLFAGAPA